MSPRSSFAAFLGVLVLAALTIDRTALQAEGQTPLTWSGSTNNTWSLTSGVQNWNLNGVIGSPASYSDSSALTFDDTAVPGSTNILIDAGTTVQPSSLVFNNDVLVYSISGGSIGGAATTVAVNNGGLVIFDNANTYGGGTTITSGTLQLGNGAVSGSVVGNISVAGMLAFDNAAAQTFGGVISGGGVIDLMAPNLVVLTSANSGFTGATTISAGTLQLGNGATIGSVAGSISNSGVLAFNNPSAQTFSGAITGNGQLAKSGAGVLWLTASDNYAGGTTISAGTLMLANANAVQGSSVAVNVAGGLAFATSGVTYNLGGLSGASNFPLTAVGGGGLTVNFDGAGSTTYSGIMSGSGGLALSSGSLTLTAYNTYLGGTNVTGGTLVLADTANTGPSVVGSGNLTIGAGGLVVAGVNSFGDVNASLLVGPAIFINGGVLTGQTSNVHLGNATLTGGTITGAMEYQPHFGVTTLGSSNESVINANTWAMVNSNTFSVTAGSVSNSVDLLVSSTITGGGLSIFKTGNGTMELNGANTFSGPATILAGVLLLGNSNALQDSVATDNVPSGGLAFVSGLGTANVAGLSGSGNIGLADLSGGSLTLNINGGTTASTYAGVLSGIGGLTVTNGVLTVTNSLSNYSGPTSITGGALVLGNTSVLQAPWLSRAVSVSNTGTLGVTAGTAAGEFSAANITTLLALSNVTFVPGTSLGIQVVDPSPFTFNSLSTSISGSEGLNKLGTGTLIIINSGNTYTGPTTITAGTLQLGNGSTSGGLPGNAFLNGGTLAFDDNSSQTFAGTISGAGTLVGSGANTLTLTNSNNFTGTATTISGGTLVLGNPNALQAATVATPSTAGALAFASSGVQYNIGGLQLSSGTVGSFSLTAVSGGSITLNLDGAGTTVYSGTMTGAGALMVSSGSLVLNNFSTFTGGTIINGGTLALDTNNGEGTVPGPITVNQGGTLNMLITNATGFGSTKSIPRININGGQVVNSSGNNEGQGVLFNFTAGTLSSTGGQITFNTTQTGSAGAGIATNSSSATALNSPTGPPRGHFGHHGGRGDHIERRRPPSYRRDRGRRRTGFQAGRRFDGDHREQDLHRRNDDRGRHPADRRRPRHQRRDLVCLVCRHQQRDLGLHGHRQPDLRRRDQRHRRDRPEGRRRRNAHRGQHFHRQHPHQ